MDAEALVVNLFLIVRVFLVGGIFFIYPRISRKGLVFGTYVGEAVAEGDAACGILRSWSRGCVLVMALSLVVGLGISLAGWPVPGNLTGTAVLLLSLVVLYLRMYGKARKLASQGAARQAQRTAAPLSVDEHRGDGFAKLALGVSLLTALATVVYATISYAAMPERIPTLASVLGITHEPADKTIARVLFVPTLSLVLAPSFALLALLIVRAKRSVRGGSGGRSVEAQDVFRVAMSQTLGGMALFTCLLLTVLSVQMTRMALTQTESLGAGIGWCAAGLVGFALASLIRIMRGPGQGGALLEEGSVEAPLTGALADDRHWILGLIYVDKDDPALLVECRFGIGYTMNLGNLHAVLMLGVYILLLLGLGVLAVTGAVA